MRYFIMANYADYKEKGTGKPVREDQIYQWIQDRSGALGIDSRPLDFLKKLLVNAERYQLFAEGKNNQGQECRYLDNIKLVSGKARTHFVLLLAAPNLGASEFAQLARELENLFFVFIVTREPTKTFDNNFGDWAKELLAATSKDDVQRFIETRIHGELRRLSARFDFAMKELSEDNIQKYRIRYVLAKISQFIDEQAEPAIAQLEKSLAYWIKAYEVEHILPQTPSPQWLEVFTDATQRRASTAMLGNLALLEAPLNASIGNMTFAEKLERYKASKLYLTQSIAMRPVGGKNTSIDRAVSGLAQFETWIPQTIVDRQNQLANLARTVWSLPAAV